MLLIDYRKSNEKVVDCGVLKLFSSLHKTFIIAAVLSTYAFVFFFFVIIVFWGVERIVED